MRLVKLGVISIVGLFLVIFLLSLLIPSRMRVSRAITINAPIDSVLYYIKDMRQWQWWNGLLKNEKRTAVKYESGSFTSTEMKVYMLSSDSTGLFRTNWERKGQPAVESGISITHAGNAEIVQWYFDFAVKWYPWEKFGSIVFDKELGPPMENSLDQLKKIAEKTN